MTDTTNTPDEVNSEDVVAVEFADGRTLTVGDLIKTYENMTEEQQSAVHFLVNAAQNGEIEFEPDTKDVIIDTAVEFDFETEMENLNKLSDTLDKAKGTENE